MDHNCDENLYEKENLQFKCDHYPPTDDEDNPVVENNQLSRAFFEILQPNPEIKPSNAGDEGYGQQTNGDLHSPWKK